jgi:hypothetical protein
MHPTHPMEIQHYDLLKGLEFVAAWIMAVFIIVLILGVPAQYRLMNRYDVLTSQNSSSDQRIRALLVYFKRLIFSVLGYQGEERERERLDQLHADWLISNFGKVFVRFSIFYFIYIWALILTTRALLIDPQNGNIQLLTYTSKQLFGFFMIGIYIVSNSLFDIFSLYFTIKHLEKINQRPRFVIAAYYLIKNIVYCFAFFLLSQLVSNLIWPLKTNLEIPVADRLFSPAIALWPYAFILDANASPPQYLNPVFPGQLLITGTVFLPSLIVVLLLAVLSISIKIVQLPKRFLVEQDLVQLGIEIRVAPGGKSIVYFRCINAVTIALVTGILSAAIWDWMKSIIFSS